MWVFEKLVTHLFLQILFFNLLEMLFKCWEKFCDADVLSFFTIVHKNTHENKLKNSISQYFHKAASSISCAITLDCCTYTHTYIYVYVFTYIFICATFWCIWHTLGTHRIFHAFSYHTTVFCIYLLSILPLPLSKV